MVSFAEETHSLYEWSRILGFNLRTLIRRAHAGWPAERILTEPPTQKFRPVIRRMPWLCDPSLRPTA
jgi:hypothetical protein